MSIVVAAVLIAALAGAIAYPLLRPGPGDDEGRDDDRERLEHERRVALLAIRESELDHSMGKLDEHDYASLRSLYERRAIDALAALDELGPGADAVRRPVAAYCPSCGRRFVDTDRFCADCGRSRGNPARRG